VGGGPRWVSLLRGLGSGRFIGPVSLPYRLPPPDGQDEFQDALRGAAMVWRGSPPRWSALPKPRLVVYQSRFHSSDTLLLLEAVRDLCEAMPGAQVTVVGPPATLFLAKALCLQINIILFDP